MKLLKTEMTHLRGKRSTSNNIRLKEILKRRALFGNQTVVVIQTVEHLIPSF